MTSLSLRVRSGVPPSSRFSHFLFSRLTTQNHVTGGKGGLAGITLVGTVTLPRLPEDKAAALGSVYMTPWRGDIQQWAELARRATETSIHSGQRMDCVRHQE